MFHGSIYTISGVQHVLNLQNSLLSLGKFHEDGCELSGRKNQLKIIKRALVVAIGELKDG